MSGRGRSLSRRRNEHRLDGEFLAQCALPLIAEVSWAQHGESTGETAIEQFTRDHSRFNRLAHADIVRDQQPHRRLPQGHDQRHELIRPWYDRDAAEGAKRPRAGAQAQTRRIKEGHDPCCVAAAHRLGIGEPRRANALAFEGQKKTDLVTLCRCQRPKLQYLGFARRQHDPLTPAGVNNRPRPVSAFHARLPDRER
jgi:hypothetical protein